MEMMNRPLAFTALLAALVLAGCANPLHRAPVEDRSAARAPSTATTPPSTAPAATPVATPVEAPKPLPGAENAGKPGYYTIKPGDTVLRVALETGQNWRDIVRWNNMDNPNVIEVGQVLRVVPPGAEVAATAAGATAAKPVTTPKIETKPLDGAARPASAPAGATTPAPPTIAASADDDVSWAWPASRGGVTAGFDDTRGKGLVFLGKAGDPVLAAADGKVIYAGNGLRGYGNLVIVKHNNTYLTTYAHNQALLVKEDQTVKRGQKIAEMGATDAERVQLQFELRRQGKPVDPARLLPPR
jgi:lipoprotein NlpD